MAKRIKRGQPGYSEQQAVYANRYFQRQEKERALEKQKAEKKASDPVCVVVESTTTYGGAMYVPRSPIVRIFEAPLSVFCDRWFSRETSEKVYDQTSLLRVLKAGDKKRNEAVKETMNAGYHVEGSTYHSKFDPKILTAGISEVIEKNGFKVTTLEGGGKSYF